jgi:hypothetical protein
MLCSADMSVLSCAMLAVGAKQSKQLKSPQLPSKISRDATWTKRLDCWQLGVCLRNSGTGSATHSSITPCMRSEGHVNVYKPMLPCRFPKLFRI